MKRSFFCSLFVIFMVLSLCLGCNQKVSKSSSLKPEIETIDKNEVSMTSDLVEFKIPNKYWTSGWDFSSIIVKNDVDANDSMDLSPFAKIDIKPDESLEKETISLILDRKHSKLLNIKFYKLTNKTDVVKIWAKKPGNYGKVFISFEDGRKISKDINLFTKEEYGLRSMKDVIEFKMIPEEVKKYNNGMVAYTYKDDINIYNRLRPSASIEVDNKVKSIKIPKELLGKINVNYVEFQGKKDLNFFGNSFGSQGWIIITLENGKSFPKEIYFEEPLA